MFKIFLGSLFILSQVIIGFSQTKNLQQQRVAPLHWWVGMKNPNLQILVYHKDIGTTIPSINHQGVTVREVHRVENPNYLFIDVTIDTNAQAGTFDMVFREQGKSDVIIPYTLENRNPSHRKAQGVTNADFIYLIMPDRFANGDLSNDIVEGTRETAVNRDSMYYRHGGDLQGVIDQLDYLEDLGVTAVWLNPVLTNDMEQASYHGYAATEFYQIDPRLGTNEKYRELGDELHKRNMKLVKDLVHNHVGLNHWSVIDPPTSDWLNTWNEYTNTTYKDQVLFDPYASQSDIKRMTDGWFVPTMPDLNHRNPFMRNYITQNHIWWIEYAGVDGFRLDTYAYNDLDFMAEWAKAVSEEYPDLTFFGETWVHGVVNQAVFTESSTINQSFDTRLQAVTDFQTHFAIIHALNEPFGWMEGVNKLYSVLANDFVYKDASRNVVFLDNHDKSRFFSEVGEDLTKYKSGLSWLLTTRGIPQLYYGAEILMKNFSNPDGLVREDFPGGWPTDKVNKFEAAGRTEIENEVFDHVKKLANYRKKYAVLQNGKMMQYVPEDAVYVYFRYDEEKTIMVVMNTAEESKTVKTARFEERLAGRTKGLDILSGDTVDIGTEITLPAKTTIVLEVL